MGDLHVWDEMARPAEAVSRKNIFRKKTKNKKNGDVVLGFVIVCGRFWCAGGNLPPKIP
jgi:hypothetical protein